MKLRPSEDETELPAPEVAVHDLQVVDRRAGRGDGIKVAEADLAPFGCLSKAEAHTIHYPNGDVTHCFALLFLATAWQGDASPNEEEATDAKFVDPAAPPEPLHAPTGHALGLLRSYLETGAFQLR